MGAGAMHRYELEAEALAPENQQVPENPELNYDSDASSTCSPVANRRPKPMVYRNGVWRRRRTGSVLAEQDFVETVMDRRAEGAEQSKERDATEGDQNDLDFK